MMVTKDFPKIEALCSKQEDGCRYRLDAVLYQPASRTLCATDGHAAVCYQLGPNSADPLDGDDDFLIPAMAITAARRAAKSNPVFLRRFEETSISGAHVRTIRLLDLPVRAHDPMLVLGEWPQVVGRFMEPKQIVEKALKNDGIRIALNPKLLAILATAMSHPDRFKEGVVLTFASNPTKRDVILVEPNGFTGSVGVIMPMADKTLAARLTETAQRSADRAGDTRPCP